MASKSQDDAAKKAATEATPLIAKPDTENAEKPKTSLLSPIYRVLLCGFLVSASFGVTQVPLVYVFRVMSCDAFYTSHPNHIPPPHHDRCSIPDIESATARSVSLLGCSTTFFGVANLFLTSRLIKRFGVRASLSVQVFWPAARLAVQNVGVMIGGADGIVIVQLSQLLTIVGGPVGYLLALNTYVANTTSNESRTGYLGRLQGYAMFGSAVGMFAGGMLAEAFGILAPFQVTLTLFLLCTVYVLLVLPYVPPQGDGKEDVAKGQSALMRAFGPLRVLAPRKWVLRDGRVRREYGAIVLSVGVFLAVLATGYIPVLLQMYATDIFEFGTKENSYLVSSHGLLRGLFLVFAFPRIIDIGRRFMDKNKSGKQAADSPPSTASPAPTTVAETERDRLTGLAGISGPMQEEEDPDMVPPQPQNPQQPQQTYDFDLIFTRYSLLIDGLLTLLASFITSGWQMYLLSAALPLGAGTAASAKGVILQMSSASERTDALSAISLVEMVARLMTTFIFGLIFAAFANVGRTWLVFVCNASVALVGFGALLFSSFPPEGATRVEGKGVEEEEEVDGH